MSRCGEQIKKFNGKTKQATGKVPEPQGRAQLILEKKDAEPEKK